MAETWNSGATTQSNQVVEDIADIKENFTFLLNRFGYRINPSETDQGASGTGNSIKDFVDAVGTSKQCTLFFPHYADDGNTTTYTLTTSVTIPSNFTLVFQPGAIIDGAGTLTVYSPSNIVAGDRQYIFGSSLTVKFSVPGVLPVLWFHTGGAGTSVSPYTGPSGGAGLGEALSSIAMSNMTYYCPTGHYESTADFDVSGYEGITVKGDGKYSTIFRPTAAVTKIFDVDNSSARKRNIRFEGFKIDGQGRDIDYGFYVSRSNYVDWHDIYIYNLAGATAGNGIYLIGDATNYCTHVTIGYNDTDVIIQNNVSDWGIEISGTHTTINIGAHLQSNGGGVGAHGDITSLHIDKSVIEGNDEKEGQKYGVYFSQVQRGTVSNTYFEEQEIHVLFDDTTSDCAYCSIGPGNSYSDDVGTYAGTQRCIKLDGDQYTQLLDTTQLHDIELTANSQNAKGFIGSVGDLTDNSAAATGAKLIMSISNGEMRFTGNGWTRIYNGIFSVRQQSACGVYLNGAQTITNNTETAVDFDSEEYDNQSEYASHEFTAANDGGYIVNGNILWGASLGDGQVWYIRLYKDTGGGYVLYKQVPKRTSSAGANDDGSFSITAKVSSGDKLELRLYQNSGGNVALATGSTNTYMSITKVW